MGQRNPNFSFSFTLSKRTERSRHEEKWDTDVQLRRFVYGAAAGALAGLVLFRSPAKRWAAIAFGAGIGIGSSPTKCFCTVERIKTESSSRPSSLSPPSSLEGSIEFSCCAGSSSSSSSLSPPSVEGDKPTVEQLKP